MNENCAVGRAVPTVYFLYAPKYAIFTGFFHRILMRENLVSHFVYYFLFPFQQELEN
jgi:hypothetical protein